MHPFKTVMETLLSHLCVTLHGVRGHVTSSLQGKFVGFVDRGGKGVFIISNHREKIDDHS